MSRSPRRCWWHPLALVSLTLAAGSAGCAGRLPSGARGGSAPPATVGPGSLTVALAARGRVPPSPEVTGVWDWVFRSHDTQGNLLVEQEEWHLVQRGALIEGYYDRALTLLSLDDHLFRCNRQLGITKFTRVRLAGSVEGNRVRVREVSFDARPGPCDDGSRSLNQYVGEVAEATLRLEWAERSGEQTLLRRTRAGGQQLAELVGLADRPVNMPTSPSLERRGGAAIHGVFGWRWRSVDAQGDERREVEEWHLDEQAGEVTGYYERRVEHLREGGVFACNHAARYQTNVRIDVAGHRTGDTLVLAETAYHPERTPCDNGLRRLDTYQGSISHGGDEIVLAWGGGNQVLRRLPAPAPVAAVRDAPAPAAGPAGGASATGPAAGDPGLATPGDAPNETSVEPPAK